MGVNVSYWLYYGVDINKEYYPSSEEERNIQFDQLAEDGIVASYWDKANDLKKKNTILIGEDHTIFGRVLGFCREDEGLYGMIDDANKYVIKLSAFATVLQSQITEEVFRSIREDLKLYFNIEDKVPDYLFIYHHS